MLAGHFGIAQLAKATRRDIPLVWLIVAAYLPDLVRVPLTLLTSHYEILSHSLPIVSALALAIAAVWMLRRGQPGAAAIIAIACLLHWPADVFTGCKPTSFEGPWIGLISYRRPINDLLLEGALLFVGWVVARRRGVGISKWWLLAGFAVQIGFLASMYNGAEFLIGDHEWVWRPEVSLVPEPHVLETLVCRPSEIGV
ncbi:MAG TPA: hypothetical protein VJN70_07905 [Gemmatimonadaceae bacterium]|nr:hypothetical protein [Gemmatimonadaceae bacterium]